jgi:hypothetical protein
MGIMIGHDRLPGETQFWLRVPLVPEGRDTRTDDVIRLGSAGAL